MTKSLLTLAAAAITGLISAAYAPGASAGDDRGDYYQPHFGIFFDFPGYSHDKCFFDKRPGKDTKFEEKDFYGKKVLVATCEFYVRPNYYKSVVIKDFKCIYVDKNHYDDYEFEAEAKFSIYIAEKRSHKAKMICVFEKENDYGY